MRLPLTKVPMVDMRGRWLSSAAVSTGAATKAVTEGQFVPIYQARSPRKPLYVRMYGITVCLMLLQGGTFLYTALQDDKESPLKPWLALFGTVLMGAVSLRTVLGYARKLIQEVHYQPLTQEVKLVFSKRRATVVPKKSVYTLAKATAETPLEQVRPSLHALHVTKRPTPTIAKSINLYHGDQSYILERNGIFAAHGKLLDMYFHDPSQVKS